MPPLENQVFPTPPRDAAVILSLSVVTTSGWQQLLRFMALLFVDVVVLPMSEIDEDSQVMPLH